jgi:hypothetical protein
MFSLLVNGAGWGSVRDTMPESRVLEYTELDLVEKFKVKDKLDIPKLISLPALFIEESYGDRDQVARIGTITRARISGRDIVLEYVYDSEIPPMTNKELEEFATDLGIKDFEFHRTHWAVKDTDIFRVLLRNMQPRRQMPKVFQIADPERIEPSLVSAMMPFHPSFDSVYSALMTAADAVGLRCRRADDIWENPAVIQDVVSLIDRSRVVICDCTDRNPNVFYEIGIAHTLGREVILITQSEKDIPFDLRHLRFLKYLNNGEGLTVLNERLQGRLADFV